MNIRDSIVSVRKRRVLKEGFSQGLGLPGRREVPLVPFGRKPFVICEIKRMSPSGGFIDPNLDAVTRACAYDGAGVKNVSVLTEQDHFGGSLKDLIEVKNAFPDMCVLRKDFLYAPEDIESSYLAGADTVLIIASLLGAEELAALFKKTEELGMNALVECHSPEDVRKTEKVKPKFLGINCRNLETFTIDKLHPISLSHYVGWNTELVYESGIRGEEDAVLAFSSGFSGILVGEAVLRQPDLPGRLVRTAESPGDTRFWKELTGRKTKNRPLVKICGLTNKEDAGLADTLGADVLGFIFAASPRRANASFVGSLGPTRALKAAVVVLREDEKRLPPEVAQLLSDNKIDVVQFHGVERPEACFSMGFPYYKALAVKDGDDLKRVISFTCPRVLLDAPKSAGAGGGISHSLLREAGNQSPLWIAGGIGPDNVAHITREYRPELIDAASRLERGPGVKDPGRLKQFFAELEHGYT